jgi:hypothetical protein
MSTIVHPLYAFQTNLAKCCNDIEIDTQTSGWHTQTHNKQLPILFG